MVLYIYFGYVIFTLLLNLLYTHMLLSRRKSIRYCAGWLGISIVIIMTCLLVLNALSIDILWFKIAFYLFSSSYIFYIHTVFTESLSKKVFTMFSIWLFSNIILFISAIISSFFIDQESFYSETITVSIRCFMQIALLPVLFYKLRNPYKKMLNIISNKTIYIMCLYPIVGFLVLINNYDYFTTDFSDSKILFRLILLLVFDIVGYVIVIVAIISASQNVALQLEYKIIENQVEFQKENYRVLNDSIQHATSLRHDTRHHIACIKTMIEEKKYDKALEYIQEFNQQQMNQTIPSLCINFTADSMIRYYMSMAIEENIEFKTSLDIPEEIQISNLDLCVVIGNCLENAIDACKKIVKPSKKYIIFKSKIIGSHIVFHIANSHNGEILSFSHGLMSTKKKRGHGIGLANVQNTVNKYKGSMEYQYNENEFNIDVVMNIKLMP